MDLPINSNIFERVGFRSDLFFKILSKVRTISDSQEQRMKNMQILTEFYLEEVEIGLKHTEKLLRKEYLAFEPIYLTVIAPDERRKTKANVELMLECANRFVDKLDDDAFLESIVNENLKTLINNDSLGGILRKRHEHYKEFESYFRDIFKSRIKMYARIIKFGIGNNYDEISISAIPTKEEALGYAQRETNIEKMMLEKLPKREYRNMLMVPGAIKIELLEIIQKIYAYAHERMIELIENGYAKA